MNDEINHQRAAAEEQYSITAHDYVSNPIGSRDWTIYWRGWQAAVELDRQQHGEPVAWHSKQYGTVWMAIKPGSLPTGQKWYISGRIEPVAEVTSPCGLVWKIATSELPHGTVFYSAPQPAKPVVNQSLTTADAATGCVREALEAARNGLQWYRDSYPDAVDGSDDEADELIDRALAALAQPTVKESLIVAESVKCVACEGKPAPENNPCGVCGMDAEPVKVPSDEDLASMWAEEDGPADTEHTAVSFARILLARCGGQPAASAPAIEALRELVTLKDMRERAKALEAAGYSLYFYSPGDKADHEKLVKLTADYRNRKDRAWTAARAVLASAPVAAQPSDWIPCSERVPANGIHVEIRTMASRQGGKHSTMWNPIPTAVTHWRPNPPALTQEGQS